MPEFRHGPNLAEVGQLQTHRRPRIGNGRRSTFWPEKGAHRPDFDDEWCFRHIFLRQNRVWGYRNGPAELRQTGLGTATGFAEKSAPEAPILVKIRAVSARFRPKVGTKTPPDFGTAARDPFRTKNAPEDGPNLDQQNAPKQAQRVDTYNCGTECELTTACCLLCAVGIRGL